MQQLAKSVWKIKEKRKTNDYTNYKTRKTAAKNRNAKRNSCEIIAKNTTTTTTSKKAQSAFFINEKTRKKLCIHIKANANTYSYIGKYKKIDKKKIFIYIFIYYMYKFSINNL